MSIELRKFDVNKELKAQRELFQECFPECIGTTTISENHYNWKFHSKLGGLKSNEFVASDENDIIGYYAAIPYQYNYNGEVLNAAMVCDVMTGVKARGKGVFTKLGNYSTNEFAKNGFDFTTGYPIRNEVIPGHIKAGWEKYFELPLYGRFIKFNSFLKAKKIGYLAPFINVLYSFYSHFLNLFTSNNKNLKVEITASESLESIIGLPEFYKKWEKETTISLVKDLDFLKWRLGAPQKKYHILTLLNKEKIVGVLIAREVDKEGVPCMGIVELALLEGYHNNANILINKLIRLSKKQGAELLLVMMSRLWFKKYKLSLSSFIKTPFKFYLIIKQLNPLLNADEMKKEENWHLMWIDSDDL